MKRRAANGQGFLITAEPPVTVTVLVGVPAVAVPGERVVVVVFEMTPSSPTVITVFTVRTVVTVRTAETTGITVFGGAATATRYPTKLTPATPPAAATAVILRRRARARSRRSARSWGDGGEVMWFLSVGRGGVIPASRRWLAAAFENDGSSLRCQTPRRAQVVDVSAGRARSTGATHPAIQIRICRLLASDVVPRIGFEPMVSALRGRCPGPLDERGPKAPDHTSARRWLRPDRARPFPGCAGHRRAWPGLPRPGPAGIAAPSDPPRERSPGCARRSR